ncbi:MAG: DUF3298 domain-containing protein, partial [Clostridia bacterium]|nr:DUF3298 domain-containing protein [Clostridia bacterium]
GKLVNEIQNDRIISLSEDTLIYLKKGTEGYRSGYMAIDGKSLMEATFSEAKDFEDGLAIVNASENYEIKFGVINKKGEFVIPAKYPLITSLGSGLFAVLEIQEYTFNTTYLRKALFDKTGKQLTDFKFYDLEKMKNGLIYATDDKTTFLIDQNGREVVDFPKVKGIGSIKPSGDLYKVEVDNYLYYYDQKGKVLWQSDNTIQLENGIVIKTNTFRPDRCIFIEYPEISGLPQGEVQEKINKTLKKKFTGDHQASKKDGDAYTETIETQFSADVKKDLLIVRLSGYYYPIGAAHGQPYKEDIHLNIGSGSFYSLKDLFKKGSRYKETVGAIIKQKINRFNKEEGGHIFSEDIGNWDESTGFTVKKDALHIYFSPYAIAPYAAGFPEFSIPYKDIMNIIDTEGEFWTSFERGAEEQPEKAENTISPDERAKIEEALKGYEVSMIEAINKNDFAIVEPWLYTDSSLYDSQKKLVQSLNRQGIKEKLQGYKIEDIRSNEIGSAYRVYVTETVAIQYPGKDYVTKTFNWVYSVKDAYEKNRYQLTYIDKWDKK